MRGCALIYSVVLTCLMAGAVGAEELTPAAHDALGLVQSTDSYTRELGFLRLEALREPAALPAIRPYTQSKDPETRAQSFRAIAAIEGAPAVPFLTERYRKEKVARVRRALLLGLEPHAASDPQLLSLFIGALRDRSSDVRMAAVDIVSRIDDPRAREAIRTRQKREHRKDVRRVLHAALDRMSQ